MSSYEDRVGVDMRGCFSHQAHELIHIKGIVGELGMCTQCWVVTLKNTTYCLCDTLHHIMAA